MLNGLAQRSQVGFLLLHLRKVGQVALTNLCSALLLLIGQDVCRLVNQSVGTLLRRPERNGSLYPFREKLVQLL